MDSLSLMGRVGASLANTVWFRGNDFYRAKKHQCKTYCKIPGNPGNNKQKRQELFPLLFGQFLCARDRIVEVAQLVDKINS